jgi:periplasmic divalent cation tolerance protein
MADPEYIAVLVTVGSAEEGEALARALVGEQLAACVSIIGPVQSVYRWQGEVHCDQERLLIIKTRAALFELLAARVKALHSYDVPEVIALPITAGSAEYLQWLAAETHPKPT